MHTCSYCRATPAPYWTFSPRGNDPHCAECYIEHAPHGQRGRRRAEVREYNRETDEGLPSANTDVRIRIMPARTPPTSLHRGTYGASRPMAVGEHIADGDALSSRGGRWILVRDGGKIRLRPSEEADLAAVLTAAGFSPGPMVVEETGGTPYYGPWREFFREWSR